MSSFLRGIGQLAAVFIGDQCIFMGSDKNNTVLVSVYACVCVFAWTTCLWDFSRVFLGQYCA